MLSDERFSQIRTYIEQMLPDIEQETWAQFEQRLEVRTIKKGEVILKPGMLCRHVSFVNKGLLRSYYLIDGKEMITTFFNEDSYFADYESFISCKPCVMYSDALEDTEVVDLVYEDLQLLYDKYPQCERVGRLIAEELFVHLCNKVSSFLLNTPEERYNGFMDEWGDIAQRVPQYMIASYLGITPEALSRIRTRKSKASRSSAQTDFIDLNQ